MLSDLISHGPVVRALRVSRGPLELHAMATGAGYERRANETYNWEGSKRGAFAVIQHTIAGRGELDYAGARHRLMLGDTMVLTFPHPNRYWLEPGQSWEYFWLGVHGREALRLLRAVIDRGGPVLRPSAEVVDRLADACLALATRPVALGEASGLAYGAATALYDAAFGDALPESAERPAPVRRAEALVERDLSGNLSVDRLAQAAGLSRAHFVRLFSATVGVAPSAYVWGKRIERAERLLLATDATVEAVAKASGFADGNYFAKAFRRARGVSPGEYRGGAVARGGEVGGCSPSPSGHRVKSQDGSPGQARG